MSHLNFKMINKLARESLVEGHPIFFRFPFRMIIRLLIILIVITLEHVPWFLPIFLDELVYLAFLDQQFNEIP